MDYIKYIPNEMKQIKEYNELDKVANVTFLSVKSDMKQVANRPCDVVALEWPICLHLESMIQDVIVVLISCLSDNVC